MKKIKYFVLLLAIAFMPFVVKAEEIDVATFDEVKANNVSGEVLNFTGSELKLTEDIELTAFLNIKANTTLDLNGHTLTLSEHGDKYGVTVYNDYTLTIEGEGTLNVEDIYGIWTAGVGLPKIIINGGTFIQTGDFYMFGLTNGEMIVNDGTFEAPYCTINNLAGEWRDYGAKATLTINGGTFKTAEDYGAPIMNSDMTIINGGTFISTGYQGNSVYTSETGTTIINKGKFTATGDEAINIWNDGITNIKDGEFIAEKGTSIFDGVEYNESAKTTVTGGTYVDSTLDIEENVAEGYIQYKLDDNTIAIGKSSMKLLVKAIDNVADGVEEEINAIDAALAEGRTMGKYYEIDYAEVDPIDNIIRTIDEATEEVTITLDVSSFPEVESGKVRTYYVYRYHNGEVEEIKGVIDNGDKTITFKSSKFSTYGVAYEDTNQVQPREEEQSNENTKVANPTTSDNILNYVIIAILSSLSLVFIIKKQNS